MDDANDGKDDDDGDHDDDDDDDDEKAVPPVQTVCERGALFLRALNSQRLLLMIMMVMVMMMTIMQRTRMTAMISKSNQLTIRQSLLYKQESNFFLFSICIFALS